jgi:hypothetical protein
MCVLDLDYLDQMQHYHPVVVQGSSPAVDSDALHTASELSLPLVPLYAGG